MKAALLAASLGWCLFSLAPAYSTSTANSNTIAKQSSTPSQTESQDAPDAAASVGEIASAKKAANAALDIVQDTLRDTAYVGPRLPGSGPRSGPHWGMFELLEDLNRAARAVSDDDGNNPASMREKEAVFSNALQRAIRNADAIASRADEREVAKEKSRALAARLRSIAYSAPPPRIPPLAPIPPPPPLQTQGPVGPQGLPGEFAKQAAESWLTLMDAGKFGDSWSQAAQVFKVQIKKGQWETTARAVRGPLGAIQSRTLKSATYRTSLPGAPDGEYVVIQYDSSFEHKQSAVETVTPMLDKDGTWRVSGYQIR